VDRGMNMGFSTFFFIAWLSIASLFVIRKRLSIVENTLIFLLTLLVSINFSWIIIEELKFIDLTKNPIDYTAYLLNRSVITPSIIVLQLNLFYRSDSRINKLLIIGSSVSSLLILSFYQSYFRITEHKQWNYFYELLYFIGLHVMSLASYRIFKRIVKDEVNYDDPI
jgi:hypothetical protein